MDQKRLGALYNGIKATFDIEGCETDAENWLSGRVEVFHRDGSSRFIPIRVSKTEYVAWQDLRFPHSPYSLDRGGKTGALYLELPDQPENRPSLSERDKTDQAKTNK